MPPAQIQNLVQEAVEHHRAGRLAAAGAIYARVRAASPRNFDAQHLGGVVALQLGRAAEAVELLTRALELDPRSNVCAMRLALALSAAGRHEDAEARLRAVLRRTPTWHEAWDNLGHLVKLRGRIDEAIACHRRSVELQPNFANGWSNLGNTLLFASRATESLAAMDKAIECDPNFARAHYGRALALQHLHRIEEAVEAYNASLALDSADLEARSHRLFALQYLDSCTPRELFTEHLAFGEVCGATAKRAFSNDPSPTRRLRVAFISPDFRTHSVSYFFEPLFARLDPAQFEIYLYHDHFVEDAVSNRLGRLATVWRNFAGQPHAAVEAAICSDAPDILIELAGHTGINRLPVLARRVAPVQASYLGYPATTGLRTVDYRFVDSITDPLGDAEAMHTEKLARFAPCAWTYAPPESAPEPAMREGEGIVFGCFNNFSKVSDATLRGWAQLLDSTRHGRLLLKSTGLGDSDVRARALTRLASAGIAPERVELRGMAPTLGAHLLAYSEIDVALDTYPYHGTTTTCEALWMGVPVVTLVGDRHASRVGASLLTAVDHPEWIATDWDEYARIALTLGRDVEGRMRLRHELRDQLRASPLLDHAGQAVRFGSALRAMWRAWCSTLAKAA